MAYGDFTFEQVIDKFDLKLQETPDLFAAIAAVESSELLNAG